MHTKVSRFALQFAFGLLLLQQSFLTSAASEELAEAMHTVIHAKNYAWGMVGTPAKLSDAEVAARKLYQKASGLDLLEGLKNASNEGKLYLLCILARRDTLQFRKAMRTLAEIDAESVSIFSGDVLQRVDMRNAISQIQKHRCDALKK